jgi:cell division protein FtsL
VAQIAIAARAGNVSNAGAGVRPLLGVRTPATLHAPVQHVPEHFDGGQWDGVEETKPAAVKQVATEIEKAVRRMPTIYVIAFFGVVVLCAVMIIWNTLQVNKLTAERVKLDDKIAQTEQRLIRLRAEEMQLSAPDRIRMIAQTKLGMVDANGEDIVIARDDGAPPLPPKPSAK